MRFISNFFCLNNLIKCNYGVLALNKYFTIIFLNLTTANPEETTETEEENNENESESQFT